MSRSLHTLSGVAQDIETIARLRSWMEDEVREKVPDFNYTKLYTDYDPITTHLSFKLQFFK